jgi:hypothetical protein
MAAFIGSGHNREATVLIGQLDSDQTSSSASSVDFQGVTEAEGFE